MSESEAKNDATKPTSGEAATEDAAKPKSKQQIHAMILSGGGANGAYQLGVARALLNGKSPSTAKKTIEPKVFTGLCSIRSVVVSSSHATAGLV